MLRSFFEENPEAAIAFSGGADSAYLLYQAAKYARRAKAYFVKSEFQPQFEAEDAVRFAAALNMPFEELPVSTLSDSSIAANPKERCYLCKKKIFSAVLAAAANDGFALVLDGSNADDDPAQRPGMRALKELAVRSPLREAWLDKADIRRLSRTEELVTWDKPSYSCLATRVPTGCYLEKEQLEKIERSEMALMRLGFRNFRLRWRGNLAKLEFMEKDMAIAVKQRREILVALGEDFDEICIDLKGRGK